MSFDSESSATALSDGHTWQGPQGARRLLQRIFTYVSCGQITIVTPSGQRLRHTARQPGPEATLALRNWRALRRLLTGGDVGFAEAYIDGEWSSPDLTSLIAFAACNGSQLESRIAGFWLVRLLRRLSHMARANSRKGSRRNIAFHYDLGNEFYRPWLDASMTYSSALYAEPDMSLEAAQQAKLDRIVESLDLAPGQSVLEIGCGWGSLAKRLAKEGAKVTGVTLSTQQLAYAQAQIGNDDITLRLQDYRDIDGKFDRIVSIEMLEAVGEAFWPTYFQVLRNRLKPGGTAVLQVITINEDRFQTYRRGADFIQRYIFPGGMLPTKQILSAQAQNAGLRLDRTECFGASYALTLAEWRRRFLASYAAIEKLGFDGAFRRLWEYYLCYCEAGFLTGAIDVGLYTLRAPNAA